MIFRRRSTVRRRERRSLRRRTRARKNNSAFKNDKLMMCCLSISSCTIHHYFQPQVTLLHTYVRLYTVGLNILDLHEFNIPDLDTLITLSIVGESIHGSKLIIDLLTILKPCSQSLFPHDAFPPIKVFGKEFKHPDRHQLIIL